MYEALYRKYRPRTFDEVVGQEYVTETLKNQVRTGRLSHAYLFIGTRGTGKTTCARILAKAVNCEHPVNGNPCNECPSCRGIEDGTVMDVVELDAASNNGVDDVRMLRDEAIFSPTTVRRRVYIIDEVHMLSKPAFNALLKILEEPPAHLMFILATTELNKVLPTILSRCQRHSFRRLDSETIAGRLMYVAQQEGIELTDDAAQLLGRLADGGMRDGLSLLDQCASGQQVDRDAVLHAMGLAGSYRIQAISESIARRDTAAVLEQYEALWMDGKEPSSLLNELAGFFRDTLLMRLAPRGGAGLISGAYTPESMKSITLTESQLLLAVNTLEKYQAAMYTSANPRLQGELCMIELCGVTPAVPQTVYTAPVPEKQKPEIPLPAPEAEESIPVQQAPTAQEPEKTKAPVIETKPEPAVQSEPAESPELWPQILAEFNTPRYRGQYFVLSNPAMINARTLGTELILSVKPGFETGIVTRSDIINKIRQTASQLSGRPIQVRIEEMQVTAAPDNDKLDQLGRFSNVTIR